jgi:hypothetical protein
MVSPQPSFKPGEGLFLPQELQETGLALNNPSQLLADLSIVPDVAAVAAVELANTVWIPIQSMSVYCSPCSHGCK